MEKEVVKILVVFGIMSIVICYFMIKGHINTEIKAWALKLFETRKQGLEFIINQKNK